MNRLICLHGLANEIMQDLHRPGKVLEFDLGPGKLMEFEKSAFLSWNFVKLSLKL